MAPTAPFSAGATQNYVKVLGGPNRPPYDLGS